MSPTAEPWSGVTSGAQTPWGAQELPKDEILPRAEVPDLKGLFYFQVISMALGQFQTYTELFILMRPRAENSIQKLHGDKIWQWRDSAWQEK